MRAALYAHYPHLAAIGTVKSGSIEDVSNAAKLGGKPGKAPFKSAVSDFYLTNPIARASAVMAECSALAKTMSLGGSLQAAE